MLESMKPKNVLIISHTFPPSNGIGGRRWAKFAKYLFRVGVDIKVIAVSSKQKTASFWDKDIIEFEDKVIRLESNYPEVLKLRKLNFIQKLNYRIALFFIKLKDKGHYFDRSICWRKNLLEEVQKQIDNGYNNILVTCGPFRAAYFLTEIKIQNPQINFIVDFRDPWTSNHTSFGFNELYSERMAYEVSCEKRVIEIADKILVVSDGFIPYWKSILPSHEEEKIMLLSNGYDKEDFENIDIDFENKKNIDGKINFVFTGNLYEKALHIFEEFCQTILSIKKDNRNLFDRMSFDFYGAVPHKFKELTQDLSNVQYHGTICLTSVFKKIRDADFMMLFLTDDLNYSFSTKFYEYISQQKPIIVFSKPGLTGEYVEAQGCGYHCFTNNMSAKLESIISKFDEGVKPETKIDISEYDVKELTKKIVTQVLI